MVDLATILYTEEEPWFLKLVQNMQGNKIIH